MDPSCSQLNRQLTQQLSITYLDPASLRANPKNARIHSKKQIQQLERSLENFGFLVPALVDADCRIVAGHGRVQAARQLRWERVPTIQISHLTDAQRTAFALADNKLAENSSWDSRLLGDQLKFLSEADLDFSLEVTGFEMAEIDLFIEGLEAPDDKDEDETIPQLGPPVSQPGDLWLLGKHRVLCGDALEALSYRSLMNEQKAGMVFTDPPFNVAIAGHASGLGRVKHRDFAMACGEMSPSEFTSFLESALRHAAENSSAGSLHFVCMDWRHMGELLEAGRQVYSELKAVCVWVKDNGGMGSLYRSQHEMIFVFKNGEGAHRNNVQLGKFGRYRTNVWQYPSAGSLSKSAGGENLLQMHPTAKPVALVADAMRDCSARGDIVLDPFLGSGTSVLAAEKTGRICYGLELDPQYVDLAVRRWQSHTGGTAMHAVSGRSFAQLEVSHGAN